MYLKRKIQCRFGSCSLHHEVIDVHGPGPLLVEIRLLQNALDLLADAEVSWDFLLRWRKEF